MRTFQMILLAVFVVGILSAFVGLLSWLVLMLRHRPPDRARRLTLMSGAVSLIALILNAFT
ncbi:hypothetical protein KTT66_00465 [Lacticaseibacillus casei]|uniref:Mas-related G-protein coupled receptor member D n=1 Tax=Lacticaseibacillus huelsenbergensis TaxID=3035291 RepID=A0ABY8DTV7_9LACO|nr:MULTISPECIES: hypothetical protein [Lacticaseibacillus]MDG3060526.1 hypothetical protein [Lacticaseibacillus sp. BCRC 81376]QVI37548.1 hypothetical protein KGS74_00770 [Lacticaseibacillus casei]QXG59335.1 hypothetical protein KTT66_00465 [Lacticaseibacillus casei]WFB39207.1 hypothetical protein LHUE1_002769 [Lacticaseibacillus huelsenbergensis]WFB40909.1 hypothetical protein LHUE2_001690 [Lacticaseibacillus huelsenbergensis]